MKFILALGIAALFSAQATHAYLPLATDDAGTQGAGGRQVELSAEWGTDRGDGIVARERVLGAALTYGVLEHLDIALSFAHVRMASDATATGWGDSGIGFKWRFHERERWSFALASVLSVPTGDETQGLGNGRPGFELNLITSAVPATDWHLHANLALDYADYKRAADRDANRTLRWRASGAVEKTVAESWLLALEGGLARSEDRASDAYPVYGGAAIVYSPSKRFDFSLGYRFALNESEIDRALTLGLTAHW